MAISTAVDAGAVARVVGIQTIYKNMRTNGVAILPQRIAIIGQGSTAAVFSEDRRSITSATEAGNLFGHGSPIHLAAKQLFPTNGDGVGTIPVTVYPLKDSVSGVAAVGDITPTGTATQSAQYRVEVNGIQSEPFVIATGATVANIVASITVAINAVLDMPVVATDAATKVTLTSKWKGISANGIKVNVTGGGSGITFALTQPTGGLVNPSVSSALAKIGNVWETMVLNCLNIEDADALNAYAEFGEGRWGAQVRKPMVVFTGHTYSTLNDVTTITDARKTDRANVALPNPGSVNLPFVAAARQLAKIAIVANNNPPCDYGSQAATGLLPGPDGVQWMYTQRDLAVKKGASTVEVRDNVVTISDVVTMYHPTGEEIPAYRFVTDIVKLQNIIYNLDLEFVSPQWDGAPLIPDDQPTVNPKAKKPKMAVAAIAALADNLGLEAIISEPDYTKKNTVAQISTQNPKRLDVKVPVKVSGNANIISVDLEFGFYFGTAAVIG